MKNLNVLPNFIIGGGVASGTSFLSATLMNHPEIYLPKVQRPEPNFFHYSWKFNQGIEWYQNLCFSDVGSQRAVGERSSLLLTSEVAAERIKKCVPDVKLIFCLRNPIERAWGNYRFTVLEGLEALSFEDAIIQEEARRKSAVGRWAEVQPHAYLMRSRYASRIREYLQLFGQKNILFIKSETMSQKPKETMNQVCDFLGVKANVDLPFPPSFTSPSVIDRRTQVELRERFGDSFSEIVEGFRTGENIEVHLKTSEDKINFERLKANLGNGKEPLPTPMRKLLLEKLSSDIREVATLVDFSVEDWT